VTQLGRTAKKRAVAALASRDDVVFETPKPELVEYVRRLAYTVLAGRAASYIQALTHQMMTPLQGALADVGQLSQGETAIRLASNLKTMQQLAVRAKLLLSEDLNVTPNCIRKVSVHRMVKKICDGLAGVASEKNVELRPGFNNGPLRVEAVPGLLELVLSGLIENAVKYSFTGLPNSPKEVRIEYGEVDGFLEVMISNLGCWVTPEEIQSREIFEMNCRGTHSTDRGRDGTGIGLYLVDAITKAHEGKVLVESCRKDGGQYNDSPVALTTFTLRWPVYSPIRDRCGE
jgi:signal transduction histidine kinase